MKRNLGNGIVKKSIVVAMSVMLLSTSPVMNAVAAEENQITTDNTQTEDPYADLTAEEKELVTDIHDQLLEVGEKMDNSDPAVYDTYDAIDDAHEVIESNVNEAIGTEATGVTDSEVTEAVDAAREVEDAAEDAKELEANVKEYGEATDELLNNDEEIVESVEGNTDDIVETITKAGDILLNVEDENGEQTQVEVEEYTQKQADIATDAAKTATDSLNNILNNSNADIAEERAKIDQAIVDAEAAKSEAETAYNAAQSVLLDQIKRYNAYAAQYGLDLYEYIDENGEVSTPAYTADELAGLSDLTMNSTEIESELQDVKENDLSAQKAEIEAATRLVESCGAALNEAEGAIEQIKAAEAGMISGLEGMISQSEEALKTATGINKDIIQAIKETAEALLEEYSKPLDQTHPEGKEDSWEARVDYAIGSASDLATDVENMVQNAKDELYGTEEKEGAVTRYQNAMVEYNRIKAEYDNYLANKDTISANFTAIEKKLEAAEKAVNAAHENLVVAVEAVNSANEVKAEFEKVVANMNNSSSSDNTDNSNATSGSSNTNTAAPSIVTVEEVAVPLTAIPEVEVPLTAIIDEPSPLSDTVPKTGDASAAAGAVGTSGLVTMLGALFMSLKRRTLR